LADAADFDELYRASRDRLAIQLTAVSGDRGEAMDHVQEAFVRAWLKWDRVGRYDDPEAWVRRVALHLAVSRWRRLRRVVLRPDVPRPVTGDDAMGSLLAALAELAPRERQAMTLKYLTGLSVEEIAVELGAPSGTVKSWLARGRSHLSAILEVGDELSDELS